MTVVSIVTTLGLSLLDVPVALALGLIAGAFDFVPFVGPIVAAVPGVLVSLDAGLTHASSVALLYLAIQVFEGYILTPLIEQRSVKLPPAVTVGAQVVLGVLIGPIGVIFATPVTAVTAVMIHQLYVKDALEHARDADRP